MSKISIRVNNIPRGLAEISYMAVEYTETSTGRVIKQVFGDPNVGTEPIVDIATDLLMDPIVKMQYWADNYIYDRFGLHPRETEYKDWNVPYYGYDHRGLGRLTGFQVTTAHGRQSRMDAAFYDYRNKDVSKVPPIYYSDDFSASGGAVWLCGLSMYGHDKVRLTKGLVNARLAGSVYPMLDYNLNPGDKISRLDGLQPHWCYHTVEMVDAPPPSPPSPPPPAPPFCTPEQNWYLDGCIPDFSKPRKPAP